MKPSLVKLWQQMSDLTSPECGACRTPHSCCSPEYCEMAEDHAATQGVTLTTTDHPTLKYMGASGCIVPPHLRPLCTLHVCSINSFGFKPGDDKWTRRYFTLRRRIERASRP